MPGCLLSSTSEFRKVKRGCIIALWLALLGLFFFFFLPLLYHLQETAEYMTSEMDYKHTAKKWH